jgi:hypothetical protein
VLINGYFNGTLDFDPTSPATNTTTSFNGSDDIFFAQYTQSALTYVSHKTIQGSGSDMITKSALDASGNLIITGIFDDEANFDTDGGSTPLFPNAAPATTADQIFVAKYSGQGSLVWARALGGPLDDYPSGLALNAGGDAFITGFFQ